MAWGICFISNQVSRPTLKARTWSSKKMSQDTFRQTPYTSRQAATSVVVAGDDAKVRPAWSDKDDISERGDEEEGRSERVRVPLTESRLCVGVGCFLSCFLTFPEVLAIARSSYRA